MTAERPDLDRYLAIKSARGGAVAADGATVAFIGDLTGIPQAWSVRLDGGWPIELTVDDDRVQSVLASPSDAEAVVFGRDSGGDERTQLHRVRRDGLGEAPLATGADVIHRPGAFSPDGRWLYYTANDRNGVDFDLFRVPLSGAGPERRSANRASDEITPLARPERVAILDGWNVVTGVSPDGSYALVAYLRGLLDADVLLVDTGSGEATNVTAVDGDRPVASFPGGFASNGLLWVRSDRAADVIQAGVQLPDGGWRPATPHRWDAEALAVADGAAATAVNVDGVSRLHLLDPSTREQRQRVPLPDGVVEDLCVAPGGGLVSFTLSSPTRPPDVWVAVVGTGEARQVTRSSTAGVDPATFVEPTLDRVDSHDGLAVPVWTYRPPDVDEPPVLVWVHGGPESQSRPAFNALFQFWVACGWAVVAPNVRGSTGYGRRYASLDDGRRRLDAVADLVMVGEWAKARPDLGDRVAVAGGSYGGYMTLSALVAEPELWAAGVSVVGIANLVTFLERTGAYRRALREREYGTLEHDRDFLAEASPLTHAERITAPLLVVHGANDPRVPVSEAEQIHDALTAQGRTCELLVFDDEGHGIAKLANRRVAYRRIHDFLAAHLER